MGQIELCCTRAGIRVCADIERGGALVTCVPPHSSRSRSRCHYPFLLLSGRQHAGNIPVTPVFYSSLFPKDISLTFSGPISTGGGSKAAGMEAKSAGTQEKHS